jgi:hypothetical protein
MGARIVAEHVSGDEVPPAPAFTDESDYPELAQGDFGLLDLEITDPGSREED